MPALTPELLIQAYANGYFPMADSDTSEVSWYRPDPRTILPLDGFHVSHSLQKKLRQKAFTATFDKAFEATMRFCANRPEGSWISEEFVAIYGRLNDVGFAHSVEVWNGDKQVGGAYGVCIGAGFFAESMFHTETDASKVALHFLVERLKKSKFLLMEVQFLTPHLKSLGAVEISAEAYELRLMEAISADATF